MNKIQITSGGGDFFDSHVHFLTYLFSYLLTYLLTYICTPMGFSLTLLSSRHGLVLACVGHS